MYAEAFFVLSMAAQAVWAGPAAATSNNPLDDVYTASTTKTFFSDAALPGPFAAGIVAQTPRDGRGVTVDVYMNNLPTEGGPFTYHIHQESVPDDGNCTETGGHLDPYDAGSGPCDASSPSSCEVGDLAGKHGNATQAPFAATYNDLYLSTDDSQPSFIGNLSLVVHYANGTRLACANFVKLGACEPSSGSSHAASGGSDATPTSASSQSTKSDTSESDESNEGDDDDESAAAQVRVLSTAALVGLAAVVLALGM